MSFLLRAVIRIYQMSISPVLGPSCRYQPTCSRYALVAIERHGSLRGAWLVARRLIRCRPGSAGGYDPVPGRGAGARAKRPAAPTGARGPGSAAGR